MLNKRTFRTKAILAILLIILLFGLSYVFGPMISISTFHFNEEHFLISPIVENYHYMYVAYGLLIISLIIAAWRKTKLTIIGVIIGVMLFGYNSYLSTQGYFALHNDYVVMKMAKAEQKMNWEDLTRVEYEDDFGGIPKKLYFYSGDELIEMQTTGQFTYKVITKVRNLASKYNVSYEEKIGK